MGGAALRAAPLSLYHAICGLTWIPTCRSSERPGVQPVTVWDVAITLGSVRILSYGRTIWEHHANSYTALRDLRSVV